MTELRQRLPRQECPDYLAFIRRKLCCVCRATHPQAAHIRMGNSSRNKRDTGMAEKSDDRWAVPLCQDCHLDGENSQHRIGEIRFWAMVRLDPFEIAELYFAEFESQGGKIPKPNLPGRPKKKRTPRFSFPKFTRKIPSRPFRKTPT